METLTDALRYAKHDKTKTIQVFQTEVFAIEYAWRLLGQGYKVRMSQLDNNQFAVWGE